MSIGQIRDRHGTLIDTASRTDDRGLMSRESGTPGRPVMQLASRHLPKDEPMHDLLTRDHDLMRPDPATKNEAVAHAPGFVDCRGVWQSMLPVARESSC